MIIMVEGKPPSVNHIYGFTWRHGQAVTVSITGSQGV